MAVDVDTIRQLVAGLDREVPLVTGESRRYVNLDNAATTPPFLEVLDTIRDFSPWYGSVHRGSGFKSQLSTDLYEECHEEIGRFVGADPDYHTVVCCANATQAINTVSRRLRLRPGEIVLTTIMEHHSNLLPWRMIGPIEYADVRDEDGGLDLADFAEKLDRYRGKVRLVALTGASNVTGSMPPVRRVARMAHEAGALVLVDAAQLVAHQPIVMGAAGDPERIDFLAFSAHKMYAPFGGGALIGPHEFFANGAPPGTVGGGTVKLVTLSDVAWADMPHKEEPGTPNVIGALVLVKAMKVLERIGREEVASHERALTMRLLERLGRIAGLRVHGEADPGRLGERVGVVSISAENMHHALLAAILSYEWGIGVRDGCFCAHPYVARLLSLSDRDLAGFWNDVQSGDESRLPGFVRISLGAYNTPEEIDYVCDAMDDILSNGPRARYRVDGATGQYFPEDYRHNLRHYYSIHS
jgi:cysteine desulfurase/selenocysteine lyase